MPATNRYSVWIESPGDIRIKETAIPSPGAGQVLIESSCSAISAGTEMLAYKGLLPSDIALDASISGMEASASYPMKYGYSVVGKVLETGTGVDSTILGQRVFVFHPHESHFLASVGDLVFLPDHIHTEDAVFLANMETAVGLALDGAPLVGERVSVIGMGVVGLLLIAILNSMPLDELIGVDPVSKRRQAANSGERVRTMSPENMTVYTNSTSRKYDLVYETSGSPTGLKQAVNSTGFHGRLIVGSWYGKKAVQLDLGSHFHRSKMSIYASQVSDIDPVLSGRWNKKRRLGTAFDMLHRIHPRRYITHQYDVQHAGAAFAELGRNEEHIQSIITY